MNTLGNRQLCSTAIAVAIAATATFMWAGAAEARMSCGGKKADIVGTEGRDVIIAPKKGQQVIVSKGGNDRIVAQRNHDTICAGDGDDVVVAGQGADRVWGGPGDDVIGTGRGKDRVHGEDGDDSMTTGAGGDLIYGETGNDRVQGGTGRDKVKGGDGDDTLDPGPGGDQVEGELGDDTLLGNSGGDRMLGGPGADRLFGELQDDHMYGEEGDDLLIGAQGIDVIEGGSGEDWMRGGTNQDRYDGGSGSDTVSFATATPPGPTGPITGVYVDLPRGIVKGDGGEDRVGGTENVVGSAYDDLLVGRGGGTVDGVLGNDDCRDFGKVGCSSTAGTGAGALNWTHVRLEEGPDPGVIVVPKKGSANETVRVTASSGGFTVTGTGPFSTGGSCDASGVDDDVFCPAPPDPLGYVAVFGADGNDRISIGAGLPASTTVDLDGGNGDDRLEGSNNDDTLYAGEFGQDTLIGNGGSDALISEVGRDVLLGGAGNDNLVTAAPCSGHLFDGGTGAADVAGFGRTYHSAVVARIGGKAVERGKKGCKPTTIRKNHEVLEGTRFGDVLYARRGKDLLIGREGRDRCFGGKHRSC